MSYIDKTGTVVISARLTEKGRSQLSIGQLNFSTFKIGDSEVDYSSLATATDSLGAAMPSYDITLQNVLRAKSAQPAVKTWLLPDINSVDGSVSVPTLSEIEIANIIQAPEKGFFSSGNTSGMTIVSSFDVNVTDTYTLNEAEINLSSLTGGTSVSVVSGSTTGSYEPAVGDLMFVRFSNPDTVGFSASTVQLNLPLPCLWYKVQGVNGSLSANTLTVELDRDLPDFTGYAGSNISYAYFYPSGNQFTSTGYYSGGTVWNQNNVWSRNMAGIDKSTYEDFEFYGSETYVGSKEFFGYTTELDFLSGNCVNNKAISIIHYSNPESCENQSELTYGQKLYINTSLNETPVLKVPTLMWHHDTTGQIGHTFSGTGSEKYVTNEGVVTDIRYFTLSDQQGNSVGRIFPDQHIFTVDDEELVAALSYKSNRNWTLPKVNLGQKDPSGSSGVISPTQDLYVTYLFHNSSSGFTTGLHCQTHSCAVIGDSDPNCGPGCTKNVEVTFPSNQLPFMSATGTTGWYADKLYLLVNRTLNGVRPKSDEWRIIDVTSDIVGHTSGKIDPNNVTNTTFLITDSKYTSGTAYSIHDYINIPQLNEPSLLQFGDENFFYGNVEASGLINKYRTKFNFTLPPNRWNWSTNPTWAGSGQNVHISDVAVYDTAGNVVAIGKQNLPIEKASNTVIMIEIAFDL